VDPRAPLPDVVKRRARAFRKAAKTPFPHVHASYHPVVLPAELIGQSGHLVYMLANALDKNEVVVGGHCRMKISSDGSTVLEVFPLSRSDLRLSCATLPSRQTVYNLEP
jgi:hypothetical protein